jgi:molybdopterin converting factor small subunit
MAQLRRAAGLAREVVDVEGPCTVAELLLRLAGAHGESFRRFVVTDQDRPQPSLLVFVGEEQARGEQPLLDGDEVILLTPMSGG